MPKKSTTKPKSDEEKIVTEFLTPEERLVLTQIGAGRAVWSQRAQALLAVEAGATNVAAGEATGLRNTQVKYWVDAFRRQGMAIFPEDILNELDTNSGDSGLTEPENDAPIAESTGNMKKTKKAKKSKKSKNSKGKKGKASKKKKQKGKNKKGRGKKKTK
jgi:hypothetical protein